MFGQINVGKLDPVSGTFTGESDVYALAGYLRGRVSGEMKRAKSVRRGLSRVVVEARRLAPCCKVEIPPPATMSRQDPKYVCSTRLIVL